MSVDGGAGADAISIAAHRISSIDGGDGNDAIALQGDEIFSVDGGAGADALTVSARSIYALDGGSGDDVLNVSFTEGAMIEGGEGDDVILATARPALPSGASETQRGSAVDVAGGVGNDVISIDADLALIRFSGGDGQDLVQVNRVSDLTVNLGTADLDKTEITFGEERLSITLEDGSQLVIEGLAAPAALRIRTDGGGDLTLRAQASVDLTA